MIAAEVRIEKANVQKLLSAAGSDAALLYLYLESGNDLASAPQELNLSPGRIRQASAALRQLGLYQKPAAPMVMVGERPQYSETDVIRAMDRERDFRSLYEEVQRKLARPLNTEELKILLGFVRYLGMSPEVVVLLVDHCKTKAARKGSSRNPSLRTVEKEAYAWAERGIDTLEEAVAYLQAWEQRVSRMGALMELLQIRGRNLSPSEEKYAQQWLDWGFDNDALTLAYDRTCLNTGGLSWAYMNKILTRWQGAGLLTGQKIRTGDGKPGMIRPSGQPGAAELDAIRKMMQEE